MEGLRQHLGILRRLRIGVERHGGEAGDEHHLDVGIELGGAPRQLDAVHLRHDDIGQQELERLLAETIIGRQAVVEGSDVVARILQGLDQEATHVVVVFREQYLRHGPVLSVPKACVSMRLAPGWPPGLERLGTHPSTQLEPCRPIRRHRSKQRVNPKQDFHGFTTSLQPAGFVCFSRAR
ncbi:hypothetical protein BOSEA31B_13485 [Hyphomicrobiales bacterium]|nr:hypothetical protein BOSEA31B_13485 [Hyphomicrobiales bacterium]